METRCCHPLARNSLTFALIFLVMKSKDTHVPGSNSAPTDSLGPTRWGGGPQAPGHSRRRAHPASETRHPVSSPRCPQTRLRLHPISFPRPRGPRVCHSPWRSPPLKLGSQGSMNLGARYPFEGRSHELRNGRVQLLAPPLSSKRPWDR